MNKIGLLCLLASLPAWAQSEITGIAHIVDGNTIQVITHRDTIKLHLAIAAPDNSQPGGGEATAFLEQYAEGEPIRCVLDEPRVQDYASGICYVAGRDIAAEVVRAGLARDCPALSSGRYWAIERPEAQKLLVPESCKSGSAGSGARSKQGQ